MYILFILTFHISVGNKNRDLLTMIFDKEAFGKWYEKSSICSAVGFNPACCKCMTFDLPKHDTITWFIYMYKKEKIISNQIGRQKLKIGTKKLYTEKKKYPH